MAEPTEAATEVVEPAGIDIEATVTDIAESLIAPEDREEAAEVGEPSEGEATPAVKVEPEKAPGTVDVLQPSNTDTPPDTWRAEAKTAWATLPPVVKEEMRKREADIASHVERMKMPVAVGERLRSLLEPHQAMFQATNTDPWKNIEAMMGVQQKLMYGSPEEKLAIVNAFAQQAGVKLENGQASLAPDATARYVRELEQRVASMETGVKSVTDVVQQARLAEMEANVRKFAEDTEAHPFFAEVADEITHLVTTRAARDLEHAYNMACSGNPVVRQKMFDAAVAKATTAREADAKAKAELARKASKARVRSSSTAATPQPLGDIDSTLKETLAEIRTR